jgi:KDO2-lipid IV(A) lauroyltransferase
VTTDADAGQGGASALGIHWTRRLASAASRAALSALIGLPEGVRRALARAIARAAYALGIRRRVTLDNLRNAFPELSERKRRGIARRAYVNMAYAVMEGLSSTRLSEAGIANALIAGNWEPVQAALDAGKGVLAATAHLGGWELVGEVLARRGVKLHVVVRSLKGSLNAQLVENRRRSGLRLIPPSGAVLSIVRALRRGEMVAMLIDQALPADRGVFVPFFGRPACTTPALSMAAVSSGAPVFVIVSIREGDHLRMFVEGPVPLPNTGDRKRDIVEHTAAITQALERYIRRYPDQWLWLHRRWKIQPIKS